MKKIKMVYLSLLGAWLLVCAVRMVLPWLRNDDVVDFHSGNYWACDYAGNEAVGDLPASIYAELNTRLEAVQPGIRVFFSPWYEGHFNCQSVVTCSLREGKPVLSPAALQELRAWVQENNVLEPPVLWDNVLRYAFDAEVDGAHDEPDNQAAEPVQGI